MKRTRTGRRIELSTRDIDLFKLLTRYRNLRSTYLYAFVGGASETRFKERLGDLFHEGYLDRPSQQWEFADARCRPAVYEIGKGGLRALCACGIDPGDRWPTGEANRQFLHSLMSCEALASIELGARAIGAVRFISWPEILAKAPEATQASGAPLRLPVPSGGFLVPDGVFGIEYQDGDAKAYRFFALEADRGTMPVLRTRLGQTSYLAKLAAYREIIAQQVHKTHWGVPNLLVLTVTTSAARLGDMLAKFAGGDVNAAFLFKATTERELIKPVPDLLTEPWQRVQNEPLCIAKSR